MFEYSLDNKRYHTLNYHMKTLFSNRTFKAVIDAGFSCPNIDGKCSVGGCIYCDGGSGEFADGKKSITKQIEDEKKRIQIKYPSSNIIAYFQAHTNTYAPIDILKNKFEEALAVKDVCGISIATRPDCLESEKIDYLKRLSEKTYLTVELGLQTVNDNTAKIINRGYDFNVFEDVYYKLKEKNIRTCIHMINGLPSETEDDMIKSAGIISHLEPDAVKIHLLHILRGTKAEKMYKEGSIVPLTKEEYIKITVSQLELLNPKCVIERITGDGARDKLVAPIWSRDKIGVLAGIDKYMAENDTYQGKRYINHTEE